MSALRAAAAVPIVAKDREIKALARVGETLEQSRSRKATLTGPDGRTTILPDSLYQVLQIAAKALFEGNGISIYPVDAVLTTQEAAEVIHVSRPHLVRLLEDGVIPFHMTGTHRRVYLNDIVKYAKQRSNEAREALDSLSQEAQELGIYDK
ncbi:MAG: helix-turn-helix domain-containing protein [Vicinamibacterales bacterium]